MNWDVVVGFLGLKGVILVCGDELVVFDVVFLGVVVDDDEFVGEVDICELYFVFW